MSFMQDNLFRGACFTNVSDVAYCRLHKLRSSQKFAKLFERHLYEPKLAFCTCEWNSFRCSCPTFLSLSFSHKNFIRWYGASCQNLYQRQKTGRKNLEINKWTLNVAYWEDREKSAFCVSYNGWNIVQLCFRLLSYIELIKNFHPERTSTTLLVSIETSRWTCYYYLHVACNSYFFICLIRWLSVTIVQPWSS